MMWLTVLTLVSLACGMLHAAPNAANTVDIVSIRQLSPNFDDLPAQRALDDSNGDQHQPFLRYQFDAHGKKFDFHLEKNKHINMRTVPVYYTDEDGKIVKKSTPSSDNFALYQDKRSNAAVAVSNVETEGAIKKRLEGFVIDKDELYELRHLEDDNYLVLRQTFEAEPAPGPESRAADDTYQREVRRRMLHPLPAEKKDSPSRTALLRTLLKMLDSVQGKKSEKEIELQKKQTFSENHINAGVELLVSTDDSLWDYFMSINGNNPQNAESELKKYFALLVNGIDLRYQNIEDHSINIYVVLAGYHIVKSRSGSTWFSGNLYPGVVKDGKEAVNTNSALDAWCNYRMNNIGIFPDHDHGMAFTRRDLASVDDQGQLSYGTAGYAPVAAICSRARSCSIVESHGGFSSFITAAHELGHNLGSHHDGAYSSGSYDNRGCSTSAGYIMAPSAGSSNPTNGYYFSACSIAEFKTGLADACCLKDEGTYSNEAEYNAHTQHLPGQLYTATQQCQMLHGEDATAHKKVGDADFCQYLVCSSGGSYTHGFKPPADGTDCDTGKWCIEGVCVSKTAPLPNSEGSSDQSTTWCRYGWPGDQCPDSDAPSINVGQGWETCNSAISRDGDRLCANSQISASGFCCVQCYYHAQSKLSGVWGAWQNWGSCSATCGGGIRTRSRTCPQTGACAGEAEQTSQCNTNACETATEAPSSPTWGAWRAWSSCSKSCGGGSKSRSRDCEGGSSCTGASSETAACNTAACPVSTVDGNWGEWAPWSSCSVTCGNGQRTRSKRCNNPAPSNGGSWCCYNGQCVYSTLTSRGSCHAGSCGEPAWGAWSAWSQCSQTCGGGRQSRTRNCEGGSSCSGVDSEIVQCNTNQCPVSTVDGNWGEWAPWSSCSVTCGNGQRTRAKTCNNPAPSNGGSWCCYNGQCLYKTLTSRSSCAGSCGGGTACKDNDDWCVKLKSFCTRHQGVKRHCCATCST